MVQEADAADPFLEMLGKKGAESETAVLNALVRNNLGGEERRSLIDLSNVRGSPEERAAATVAALAERPDVIYQAPMLHGDFFGIADFLVRIPGPLPPFLEDEPSADSPPPSSEGAARYMVWDAKLARSPRPSQALQLCCYAEMLAALQGAPVDHVGLVLGATPLILPVANFAALYRRTRDRFLAAQDAFTPGGMPDLPDGTHSLGRWSSLAASELLRRDDLRQVARLSSRHARLLRNAGITTATQLAALDRPSSIAMAPRGSTASTVTAPGPPAPPLPTIRGLEPAMLRRLCRQAAL